MVINKAVLDNLKDSIINDKNIDSYDKKELLAGIQALNYSSDKFIFNRKFENGKENIEIIIEEDKFKPPATMPFINIFKDIFMEEYIKIKFPERSK